MHALVGILLYNKQIKPKNRKTDFQTKKKILFRTLTFNSIFAKVS